MPSSGPFFFDTKGDAFAIWEESAYNAAQSAPPSYVRAEVHAAGGRWLGRQTISIGGGHAKLAVDAGGEALALWDGAGGARASLRPTGGTWQPPQTVLPHMGEEPLVASDQRGDSVVLESGQQPGFLGIYAAARPAGGTFSREQSISGPESIGFDPQLAMNGRGDAFAVWDGDSRGCVVAAFRPAGGTWSTPRTLAVGQRSCESGPQVAIDENGEAIVVWKGLRGRETFIEEAGRSAHGRWVSQRRVSPAPNIFGEPEVGMDARERDRRVVGID